MCRLSNDAFERRTGGRVELLWHAAGEVCLASGEDGMLHRFGHQHRILRAAMPVFISTASAPSSIAMAASEAVPTPASTISGTP